MHRFIRSTFNYIYLKTILFFLLMLYIDETFNFYGEKTFPNEFFIGARERVAADGPTRMDRISCSITSATLIVVV